MDISEFIERLNEDLGTEFQSIVQFTHRISTFTGAEYVSTSPNSVRTSARSCRTP